jgi:ABC-type antimicrobial peptide transport system permease subunit
MLASAVRRAVAAVDRALPAYDIETMRQRLDNNESLVRFELFTLSIFAMISVLLVSTGLYGVIAYTVTQRTGEIGLRIALGAQSKTILVAVVRESALITLAGIVLGLLSSLALMRLISAVLFGVTPHDPRTLATVCMLFLAVATLASYLPARRAASIDPAQTLRSE